MRYFHFICLGLVAELIKNIIPMLSCRFLFCFESVMIAADGKRNLVINTAPNPHSALHTIVSTLQKSATNS